MEEIDICGNFRPYSQSIYTKHLGCVNCGKMAIAHKDVCLACSGIGRIERDPKEVFIPHMSPGSVETQDCRPAEQPCASCAGTGRASRKNAYDNI
jgi:hypothetical protein